MTDVAHAVHLLRAGRLVAFPTETVYGLGADATQSAAVRAIFAAKGRPSTNPLIVHVADAGVARRYAAAWPDAADRLARKFWPGPLTLVLPAAASIVPEVTAGLGTVGLRSPDHPLALDLLRQFDGPVAAPSANRSTRISPTTAEHVRDELGTSVDCILDGGPCRVGIESTVLDLASPAPRILRPGHITREQIEAEIGPVALFTGSTDIATPAASPGQHTIHYAPRTPAYRFDRDALARASLSHPATLAVLFLSPAPGHLPAFREIVEMPATPAGYAHRLYSTLRRLDRCGVEALLIEMPPDRPEWSALRDRLTRATRPL